AKTVGFSGDVFVLVTGKRPELPACKPIAMTYVVEWIDVIIGHDILFSALAVEREHDEVNLVAKHAIAEMAVKRKDRKVVFLRLGGTLLNVNRKEIEAPPFFFFLRGTARPIQQLKKLPAILLSETVIGQQRIEHVIFGP